MPRVTSLLLPDNSAEPVYNCSNIMSTNKRGTKWLMFALVASALALMLHLLADTSIAGESTVAQLPGTVGATAAQETVDVHLGAPTAYLFAALPPYPALLPHLVNRYAPATQEPPARAACVPHSLPLLI